MVNVWSFSSVSILPVNIEGWFPLGWTVLISLLSNGLSRVFLIPSWITVLSCQRGLGNSMKLWTMMCRATQDRRVTVKSSDKTWSAGGGSGKPLQYSCQENPMKLWKDKKTKRRHWKMSPPGSKVSNMLLGKSRGHLLKALGRMKQLGQKWKRCWWWK